MPLTFLTKCNTSSDKSLLIYPYNAYPHMLDINKNEVVFLSIVTNHQSKDKSDLLLGLIIGPYYVHIQLYVLVLYFEVLSAFGSAFYQQIIY